MARGLAAAVAAVFFASAGIVVPVLTAAPVQAATSQTSVEKAVANAIAMGGSSAKLIADNITRLILNNPAYAAQIVQAVMNAAADPATPAGLAQALGNGLGAAYALASTTPALQKVIGDAYNAAMLTLSTALSGSGFASAVVAGAQSVASGTIPAAANIPTQAALDAVLASFTDGLPVNETGTVSRN